jgi:hypothetical protein
MATALQCWPLDGLHTPLNRILTIRPSALKTLGAAL